MVELIDYSMESDDAQHWLSILRDEEIETISKGKAGMEDAEEKKTMLKKLNAQATALKMDLHDLAEDLPTGWERIMEVAEKAYKAYLDLSEAKKRMAGN